MKLTDNLVNKIGQDKLLHFLFSGMIASLIMIIYTVGGVSCIWLSYLIAVIATLLITALAYIKELYFDKEFDIKDIVYSVLGTIPVYIAISIGLLLNLGN